MAVLAFAAVARAEPARAPSGPALSSPGGGVAVTTEEPANASAQAGDPLVSNGLGSPLCRGRVAEATLSGTARRNCVTSGFVASAAPTGNYGLDVHIDTGVLGLSQGELMSALQDLLVTPLWMALVWVIHAVCVMLEWCFTLNLLDSPMSGQLGRSLRQMQQALTEPWIPVVLSIACVVVLYDGLVRRRVADTLGQALMMAAMMVAGLWAIADPGGTIGSLASWANEASLGTLAAAAQGTPSGAPVALGQSMQVVFSAAIEVPWCYLEFGNVGWCREAGRTEPRLRAAGLKIASQELSEAGCGSGAADGCPDRLGTKGQGLVHSAQLLREAHTNGAIFLALPADGPQRNSINDEGSLLRTICQSSDATDCHGAAAAEAEFRTGGQTWSRMGGLLLIVCGALGMVLLLGFIALRLLSAAIFSLLYLLVAPGMVLAPALGEGGRAIFRRWAGHLLSSVVSKLLFSFLLGVVLAVLAILASLRSLGWWTQWLLMSAFWWGAFLRRHQALGVAHGAFAERMPPARRREPRTLVRRVSDTLESRKGMAAVRWARDRHTRADQGGQVKRPSSRDADGGRSRPTGSGAARATEQDPPASGRPGSGREGEHAGDAAPEHHLLEQLERVRRERRRAEDAGDRRRALTLGARAARIETELHGAAASEHGSGAHLRKPVPTAAPRPQATDAPRTRSRSRRRPREELDDGPHDPERRRRARLSIDRELALLRERLKAEGRTPPPDAMDVMRDARDVEAGRKRFLGPDLP
ncbi:MAG TPA: hypothetical protein VMB91_07180 [Solirubrobacteraceae bacterium]|nr:hypothetical protein [Solirubrobacteraceae bacterium]